MKYESPLCNACGCPANAPLRPYFKRGEVDFFRCGQCDLVFRCPMPTPRELDVIYQEHYSAANVNAGRTNQESGEHALDAYVRTLYGRVIRPQDRVLDFGCGTGALVEKLRRAGVAHVDGLETSANARTLCQVNRGIGLLSSLTEVPSRSVDLITMIEVIEHLTNPLPDLCAIREKIKPGGLIFVTTPNRLGTRARVERGLWREARKKFHLFLFSAGSMESLLQRAGFVDVRQIRFSPVQRSGPARWLATRMQQAVGLGGTLCFTAKAPK